ncbi:glycosyltransferase family 4 protein [Silvimonas iriomotensis]|uniref:Glycosyl transferase n=1 Tax=Silvimonas iriomotensis TaxID=449662 RepID=A0ABQ2PBP1_9NEIS|nr:glycosyltransferase family 4 protein [Silvimonas iriomotensis]GGP22954.1 glycosyl transferase [Silvimonas iriomotensis]
MKILELDFEAGWRGGERQTFLSMQQFRASGHEVHILCRRGGKMAERASAEGFVVHACTNVAGVLAFLALHGGQYDVLHPQTGHMLSWAVLTRWFHRRPVVYSRRVAFALNGTFTRYKYHHADQVVAISQACADSVRALGVHDILIIPSAVLPVRPDTARIEALAAQLGVAGRRVVATTSALTSDKDPLMLVDAVAALHARRNDFVFVHFGAGNMAEVAKERVIEQGLEHVFLLAGYQQNVESLFGLFDVFVMSSREEGLGSSVLDAFSARVPVASTDAGGLKELLAEGRGLLSPVGDSAALAANIDTLLDASSRVVGMVERAHEYVERVHSVEAMANGYLRLFESLVQRARPR